MAEKLDSTKRANQIEGIEQIRYLREELAADIFGLPLDKVYYFASAAGAIYQLPKITLTSMRRLRRRDVRKV